MGSVTVYTATKIEEVLDAGVVDASITDGHIILELRDGSTIDIGSIISALPGSTTSVPGLVELATDTETTTGTDTTRAVTPFGLAALTASDTRKGLVELATPTEAVTGTDTSRAVTVAGLLATKVLSSDPGESAVPSSYPAGSSLLKLTSSSWSLNSGNGMVQTTRTDTAAAEQVFYTVAGGTQFPRMWFRQYHSTNGGGGWTAWQESLLLNLLTAASFTQATVFTSYPQGTSRLYYSNTTSTSWDFTGLWGEVLTFRDGSDYAKQQFTEHVGGSSNIPRVWVRTANSGSGWSKWQIVADETGYLALTFSGGAGFSLKRNLAYRRRNGAVYVKGAFTAPSGGFTTFATLPSGFRPPENRQFPITTNSTVNMALQINTDGTMQCWTDGASTSWFSVDNAFFFLD